MKNIQQLILLVSITLLLCCSKENIKDFEQIKPENVNVNLIKDYLTTVKSELLSAGKIRLDSVQNNLLWDKATFALSAKDNSIVQIPIREGSIYALFYLSNSNNKVDSSVICFSVDKMIFSNSNDPLALRVQSTANTKFEAPNFSIKNGDVKIYSIDNVFKKLYHFENGKLKYTKEILPGGKKSTGTIKAKASCIDWYWVTTYPDGSQTWEYLYSTCDCGEQINSIDFRLSKEVTVKNNCGGGGGTTGGIDPNYDPDLDPNNYPDTHDIQMFENDYRSRMTIEERVIYDGMTRIQQLQYLYNAQTASDLAEDLFPNSLHNGQGDAFRHALFNALNAKVLGVSLTTLLADAHELNPYQDPLERQMDLFNNQVGRNIYQNITFNFTFGNLYKQQVLFALSLMIPLGDLRMISPLNSDGNIIPGVSQLVPTHY